MVDELFARRRRVDPLEELTPRERKVLALIAEGRSNQGICRALWLSPKTIETHIRSAFSKLGIKEAPEDNRRVLAVLTYLQRYEPSVVGLVVVIVRDAVGVVARRLRPRLAGRRRAGFVVGELLAFLL